MADAQLTIGIRADASQMRADLAVVNAEISALGKNLRAAATESLVTGDKSGVLSIAGQIEAAVGHQKNLKAEIALSGAEALTFSQRLQGAAQGLEQVAGQFRGGIGAGLFGGGLSGGALAVAGVVAALGELYHLTSEAAERAHQIEALSGALGVSTGQVKAWTIAAHGAGVSTEELGKSDERLLISAEKAAQALHKQVIEAAKLSAETEGGVYRGGMHTKAPPRTSEMIDVGATVIPTTPKVLEYLAAQRAIKEEANKNQVAAGALPFQLDSEATALFKFKELLKSVGPAGDAARISYKEFGGVVAAKSLAEGVGLLEKIPDLFTKAKIPIADVNGKLLEAQNIIRDTNIALSKMSKPEELLFTKTEMGRGAIDPVQMAHRREIGAAAARGEGPLMTPPSEDPNVALGAEIKKDQMRIGAATTEFFDNLSLGFQKSLKDWAVDAKKTLADEGPKPSDVKALADVDLGLSGLIKDLAEAAGTAATGIASAVDKVVHATAALGEGPGGLPGGLFPAPGNAAGGLIRGPGTGTSDSILARMSTGEFVVNAADTARNYGLLHAINSGFSAPRFALGGLVPGFAAGGPVTAGGGGGSVTVNLVLGGENFAMVAPQHVADKLVRAARQSDMLSAGKRPGWNGG